MQCGICTLIGPHRANLHVLTETDHKMDVLGGANTPCSCGQTVHSMHVLRGRPCIAVGPFRAGRLLQQRRLSVRVAAEGGSQGDKPAVKQADADAAAAPKAKAKRKSRRRVGGKAPAGKTVSLKLRRSQQEAEEIAEAFTLDDFNPVAIGKRSRQVQTRVHLQKVTHLKRTSQRVQAF